MCSRIKPDMLLQNPRGPQSKSGEILPQRGCRVEVQQVRSPSGKWWSPPCNRPAYTACAQVRHLLHCLTPRNSCKSIYWRTKLADLMSPALKQASMLKRKTAGSAWDQGHCGDAHLSHTMLYCRPRLHQRLPRKAAIGALQPPSRSVHP